jgi:hypothetical protein
MQYYHQPAPLHAKGQQKCDYAWYVKAQDLSKQKQTDKNIQQRGFASGHPPDY